MNALQTNPGIRLHRIIEPQDMMDTAVVQEPCIVKLQGKYPIKFHPCWYEIVREEEATHFTNPALAYRTAAELELFLTKAEISAVLPEPMKARVA